MKGKVALITGGTKGLGLATARALAGQGADAYLSYRSDEVGAAQSAQTLRSEYGVKCEAIRCDLSEEGAADRLFDAFLAHSKRLDYYVHNAAATAFKGLMEIKPHHVDKTFNITVKSLLGVVQRAVPIMKSSAGGSIVTVSGMDTLRAVPTHGLLGAAKSALETLTAYFAHELAEEGIRVNGVNPGFLSTDSTRKMLGPAFETVASSFAKTVPLRREARLEEIADVILFLLSERSSWMVGQTLVVDGGFDFALNQR